MSFRGIAKDLGGPLNKTASERIVEVAARERGKPSKKYLDSKRRSKLTKAVFFLAKYGASLRVGQGEYKIPNKQVLGIFRQFGQDKFWQSKQSSFAGKFIYNTTKTVCGAGENQARKKINKPISFSMKQWNVLKKIHAENVTEPKQQ